MGCRRKAGIETFILPALALGFALLVSRGVPIHEAFEILLRVVIGALVILFVAVAILFGISFCPHDSLPRGLRNSRVERYASKVSKSIPFLPKPAPRDGFTWDLLQNLEWRSFEKLVTGYFRLIGFEAERRRAGADGGVDIVVRKTGGTSTFAYVQCKAWNAYLVGVKPVRELYGVMAAEGVAKGYFVTSGTFTPEATAFAEGKRLKLVTGTELLQKLGELNPGARAELLEEILAGDYTTPTCPSCDEKMVRRKGKDGAPFWGCRNFPKCWKNFPLRKPEK